MDEHFFLSMERGSSSQRNFLRVNMYEIWDGDVFLFCVDDTDEANHYFETGFDVRTVNMD